ncbi:LOW QUALITY PROTEIN: formamidopyrimidine-DNA glycosylase [Dioscorea cayenensis subsp. rotundata]|uniref:LOW QUALITY PROTEIN: formamidopyrimidine-DNA glycosylase n=1 Tax=Dioscorea cayennensis subsp. rotundata TaxID=55577 RepID=A0AB40CVU8_DIOCR|nr:LOW QUALITY PROTEIN: formamidopyrimidine-DNA glycosylase [Dioscorea cayenensis subsp. rotundata]
MPELPEVEAARRALEEHCVGKRIRKCVAADDAKVIDGVPHSVFESSLTGKTIVATHRKGKNLWLQLDSPPFPSFQFGMAGAVYIKGVAVTKYKRAVVSDEEEWPSKYSKVFVELEDGLEFSFTDKRRFARVRLLEDPTGVPPISTLGPDALTELMPLDEFVHSLSEKKIAIKALLLDQSFISGIGNWVADEVLYQACIHPLQPAASLSKESCQSLHRCIKEVIQYAVEVDADSTHFPIEWLFHVRWGKKSGKLNGKKIDFVTAGGRTSAFVPELQKLIGAQSGKTVVQATKRSKLKESSEAEESDSDEDFNAKTSEKKSKATTVRRKKQSDDDSGEESAVRRIWTKGQIRKRARSQLFRRRSRSKMIVMKMSHRKKQEVKQSRSEQTPVKQRQNRKKHRNRM